MREATSPSLDHDEVLKQDNPHRSEAFEPVSGVHKESTGCDGELHSATRRAGAGEYRANLR